jgi:peptide/nickel transport system substrate-binding protein
MSERPEWVSEVLNRPVSRRHLIKRAAIMVAVPPVVMALLEACSKSPVQTAGPSGSTASSASKLSSLIVAVQAGDTRTLDPQDASELSTPFFLRALYDQLATFPGSAFDTVVGDSALNWTVSADGLSYVFNLNPNIKFSDGSSLTPEDVVFSLNRHKYLKGPTSWFQDQVASVEKTGDHQVTLKLSAINVGMLDILTCPFVSIGRASTMQANGATDSQDASTTDTARTWLDAHSVGSGPFVLDSWERGQTITMHRNPYYWGKQPPFEKLVCKLTQDQTVQRDLLQRGDVHIAMNLSPDLVASLSGAPNVGIVNVPSEGYPWLGLHVTNNPALKNPKNWEAVKYAIDYVGLAGVYKTGGRPAAGCIPQGMANALPANDSSVLKQDVSKAKAALAAAGNPTGFTFKMTYASDQLYQNVPATDVAQKVASDLQAVGIDAVLNPEPASQESTDFRAGKLEASIHVWGADYLGWTDFLPNFCPGGNVAAKRQGWLPTQSSEAQQIADWATQAEQTVDATTQNDLCIKAQQLMNQVGPHAWLFEMMSQIGYRSDVIKSMATNPVTYVDVTDVELK